MIVGGAVGTLVATADLADVQHVQLVEFDYGLVEPLRCVVVVDADGQVARHVGYWIPPFEGEVDASLFGVQSVEVEHYLLITHNLKKTKKKH